MLIVLVQNCLQNVRIVGAMFGAFWGRSSDSICIDDRPKAAMIVNLPIVESRQSSQMTRVAAIEGLSASDRGLDVCV